MDKFDLLNRTLLNTMTYQAYFKLTEELLGEGKTTGPNQTEDYVHYTNLNFHRMKRLYKTVTINSELATQIQSITLPQTWLVIAEAWCGDVAQNLPILQKMADLSENVELKITLRDENLHLMDLYLTNGGRSIPKLIALDNSTQNELFTWGPRPSTIQKVMNELKAENVSQISEIVEKIQIAYNADKSQSIQIEFLQLLTEKNN